MSVCIRMCVYHVDQGRDKGLFSVIRLYVRDEFKGTTLGIWLCMLYTISSHHIYTQIILPRRCNCIRQPIIKPLA